MEDYLNGAIKSKKYFTVAEYFLFLEKEYGIERPKSNVRRNIYKGIGSECSSICDVRNIIVKKEPHEKFDSINKYPEHILAEVFFGEANREYFPRYSATQEILYPSVPRRNQSK